MIVGAYESNTMNVAVRQQISMPRPLSEFVQYAVTAPSADNSQPWVFSLDNDRVICRYQHAGGGTDPFGSKGHGTLVAAGALQENIDRLLFMLDMPASVKQLDSDWSINFSVPCRSVPASAELNAILSRHTNRFPYRRIERPDFTNLPYSNSGFSRLVIVQDRKSIGRIGDAVRACAEARFNTKELHEWLFGSMRWSQLEVRRGDGLDLSTVHLPPGGRQFMRFVSPWSRMAMLNRLGLYKLLAGTDTAPIYKAPCIMAIIGDRSVGGAWDAGRVLQSLWIALNRRQYAVHPYYVTTDLVNRLDAGAVQEPWRHSVATANSILKDVLEFGSGEQVHMLLRVGEPTTTPTRSLRKAVSELLT